jgi:hypothetical protein
MRLPNIPLYLHALSPDEIDDLQQIVDLARKADLFEQHRFIGQGLDVRNFYRDEGATDAKQRKARPSAALLSKLYNWVMNDLAPLIDPMGASNHPELHKELYKKITELNDKGVHSGRYDRDVTVSMNKFIDGDILRYNVPDFAWGFYIGYRFRTDQKEILRFVVNIDYDEDLKRTKFWSFLRLSNAPKLERKTRGFAYFAEGNIYLSGFINAELGCEFITMKKWQQPYLHAGLVVTTSPNGSPVAKSCVLIEARKTLHKKYFPNNPLVHVELEHLHHQERQGMIPILLPANSCDITSAQLAQLLQRSEGLEPEDSELVSMQLSRSMIRIKTEATKDA